MSPTTMGGEVKIIGRWPSPYVLRPRIALNLKGVEYEFLEEPFGAPKSQLLLDSNPVYQKIPVLLHRGKPICESMIIVQYIDEVWTQTGSAILPEDPCERAIHRFWAAYLDDKLFPLVVAMTSSNETNIKEAMAETIDRVLGDLRLLEEAFEKCSGGEGKGFFGGDTIGYLDIAFGSWLGWLRVVERILETELLDEEKTPLLVGWAERFCAHEFVKEVMPETDKLLEFRDMIMDQIAKAVLL